MKESSLPPALMAKKTREFRCPPKDQVEIHLKIFKKNFHEENKTRNVLDASIDEF